MEFSGLGVYSSGLKVQGSGFGVYGTYGEFRASTTPRRQYLPPKYEPPESPDLLVRAR